MTHLSLSLTLDAFARDVPVKLRLEYDRDNGTIHSADMVTSAGSWTLSPDVAWSLLGGRNETTFKNLDWAADESALERRSA